MQDFAAVALESLENQCLCKPLESEQAEQTDNHHHQHEKELGG